MSTPLRFTLVLAALLLGVVPPRAWSAGQAPAREISEKTAAQLGQLRDLTDAKNYASALVLLDRLLTDAPAESYDTFVLSQVKAQVFLAQNRYADALPPLETSLRLADARSFLEPRAKLDLIYLLAQVSSQLAAETKAPDAQRAQFGHAYTLIRRWLAETPAPTPDAQLFAASVLYNQAQAAVPATPAAFAAALGEAEKGLRLSIHPGEQFYVLILASLQQLGELVRAADILELLVAQHTASVAYWQQLAATYLNLAADAKDPRAVRRWQIRALLTIERAQERGLLRAPKDNFNLVGLCYNLGRFERVIALLEAGLADGTLANDRRNWELLADACQQAHQDARAIATLERAVAHFPADGSLSYSLAQLHYNARRLDDARADAEAALARGGLEKPGPVLLFLAYVCYELRQLDDAARWLDRAAAEPGAPAADLARLRQAIVTARLSAATVPSPP